MRFGTMRVMRLVRLVVALVLLVPVAARAVEDAPRAHEVEQPFSFLVDPHGPAPRQVLAGYALAFSSSAGAIRPVPGHFDSAGVVHALTLEAGVLSRLSLYATALIAEPLGVSDVGNAAVQAGARLLLTPPAWDRFRLVAELGFLREFGAALGMTGELTGSYDVGRVRLAAAVHVEHVFAAGRDPVDVYAVAAASVRVHRLVRVGAEYVAQDLEAAAEDDEAEGGARHYVGPDLALSLLSHRLLVTAAAAVQIAHVPGALVRGGLTYVY